MIFYKKFKIAFYGMHNKKSISDLIKFLRKEAGLSQIQLSEMAGVARSAVQHIEAGKLSIQFNTVMKIGTVLNLNIILENPLARYALKESDHAK
jgi:transcriptional regulator with XRE-family HTH domain